MENDNMTRPFKYKIISVLIVLCCFASQAKNINIQVNDTEKNPLTNIVVYIESVNKVMLDKTQLTDRPTATMDQVNRQFSPKILVVNKATKISFPNSDKIKHHVYSFSPAKTFEIKLYSDKQSTPLLFNQTGEVTLGCNIHDWMIGYVYVVDTPWFGKTDLQGNIEFELPQGKYNIKIWHPLLQDEDQDFTKKIDVNSDNKLTINLKEAMKPAYSAYDEDDELDVY
ncbi:MAG: methylamine utilization protein [Colwellia sp.]|nr:methylamine utilization protein [Colwellia sp.]